MGVEGDVDTVAVVLFVIALAVMGHFEFEAGSGVLVPTQLIFGLSALKLHGFELVGLRYFRLEDSGAIHYLDDAEVAAAPETKKASA